jgi:hypothetical protein
LGALAVTMAIRPVFVPRKDGKLGVNIFEVEFKWFPGMAKSQSQKSIDSLHKEAEKRGIKPILEISTKSKDDLGIKTSAFNLIITTKIYKDSFSVENAFQSSKVFQYGGPYEDLLFKTSKEAKKDIRLKKSGRLLKFQFYKKDFPLQPRTFFYDWLYINALEQNKNLAHSLLDFSGFTDIVFNPKKSINCQAFSAALYVSLCSSSLLGESLESPELFLKTIGELYEQRDYKTISQSSLY